MRTTVRGFQKGNKAGYRECLCCSKKLSYGVGCYGVLTAANGSRFDAFHSVCPACQSATSPIMVPDRQTDQGLVEGFTLSLIRK